MLRESEPRRSWLPWAIAGCLLALAWYFREVLGLLVGAFGLAYLLEPLVQKLEDARVPRPLAIVVVLLLVSAVLTGLLAIVVPNIVHEGGELLAKLPAKFRNDWLPALNRGLLHLRRRYHVRIPVTADAWLAQLGNRADLAPRSLSAVLSAANATVTVLEFALEVVIVLAMAFYVLLDWHRIHAGVAELVPHSMRPRFVSVVGKLDATMGRFLRGQLLVMIVLGTLFAVGFELLGVPAGAGLGILAGMISFVPYLGFVVALALAVLLSSLQGGGSQQVLAVVVYMAVVHVLDLALITPRILGGSLGLSPVLVIMALLAGGKVLGFAGLLVAIPVAAMLRVLVHELLVEYRETHFFNDPPPVATRPDGSLLPEPPGPE
ncbi:MAG: AI-2E family transporter [Deltaproteobacteria bacterium]|nr:AI-2E family transporter [Deltaproteobacteria bacterium]